MEDFRLAWMRDRVYDTLDVNQKDAFEELLRRDEGSAVGMISKYFDETTEDTERPLIFYKLVLEQEEEVEVECGKSMCNFM